MRLAHRCLLFGRLLRLEVPCQGFNHLLHHATFESLLLCPAPLISSGTLRTLRRRGQIFTDMKKIAQKGSLFAEHLLTMQPDPFRSVSDGVNLAIQSPARLPRAVPQAAPNSFHLAEGGSIDRSGTILGLRCHQPHFLPLSGTFALSLAGFDGADQRSVSLGNDMFRPHPGQNAEGLRVSLLQLLLGAVGMLQSDASHRAGSHFKTIMLLHTLRGFGKRMLATKVR